MRFNIFEFGNLKIHQLRGMAMSTSSACIWATIYYAIHENETLLPCYSKHLYNGRLLRFIDDICAIWIFEPGENQATSLPWKEFCADLKFGRLTWKVTKPSRHAIFLDLNLYIVGKRIITSTYQKELNLYLYLPGSSAHTLGMIKGTIYGQLLRYYEHNSVYTDYLNVACLLYSRLLARGHRQQVIRPIFLEAHSNILPQRCTPPRVEPTEDTRTPLHLHFEYHPKDVPRLLIQKLYYTHFGKFKDELGLAPPKIAHSRPTNLGKIASQAKLHKAPGRDATTHLNK